MYFHAPLPLLTALASILSTAFSAAVPRGEVQPEKVSLVNKREVATIPFRPGTDFTQSNLTQFTKWFSRSCTNTTGNYYAGIEIKTTVTYSNNGQGTSFKDTYWWTNRQSYTNYPGSGKCNLFGRGQYKQCSNGTFGELTESEYHGVPYQTYYDCLLKRNVQHVASHPQFGRDVIYWSDETWHSYRFFDENDFAWFVSCPVEEVARAKRGLPVKRGSGGRIWATKNPEWDFGPTAWRDRNADATALDKYILPVNKTVDNWAVGATWWGRSRPDYYMFGDVQCEMMAVSRPNLKHWTAVFYYITFDKK